MSADFHGSEKCRIRASLEWVCTVLPGKAGYRSFDSPSAILRLAQDFACGLLPQHAKSARTGDPISRYAHAAERLKLYNLDNQAQLGFSSRG